MLLTQFLKKKGKLAERQGRKVTDLTGHSTAGSPDCLGVFSASWTVRLQEAFCLTHSLGEGKRIIMKLSKRVRLLVILMLALGLFALARMPSAARRSVASSTPQVVAWLESFDGFPGTYVNWNG
jgi:hypothetical protein